MDFANSTDFHAKLLCASLPGQRQLGCVIARPAFRIEGRRLAPVPEPIWPIDAGPLTTSAGEFPGDKPLLTGGIDVFVLGSAYAPGGEPVEELQVRLRVGSELERSLRVVGNRIWERARRGLRASQPEPFVSLPLSYANAYGGRTAVDGGELPCATNPEGKGYYLSEEAALGGPLPNLEDPASPITSWQDQPEPAGVAPYPAGGSLRALNALEFDPENVDDPKVERIKPLLFNLAHPKLILAPGRAPKPGDEIEVTCVRPEGDLRFEMPDLSLHVHVQLEDRSHLFPLHLDQIGIFAEEGRVMLSYRVVFRYRLAPLERRRATLHAGPVPESLPPGYVAVWEED